MIGRTISHYLILEKLGEGGMGVVYKAKDTRLDRVVALKFLPKHFLCDDVAKMRFFREARSASSLDHQNIATVYEIDDFEGECFISMAYIEGRSLKKVLKEGALSIGEILSIASQIAEGLQAAHKKGIVHRDIKSDNILLTPEGLVKIMDFGLAKLKGGPDFTATRTLMGTISYMSPEHVQGSNIDQRSDIFSLGVVLYELLTGHLPFQKDESAAILYSILHEEPLPLTSFRPDVPAGMQKIVDKILAKDQRDRYQSMEELLADLRSLKREIAQGMNREPLSLSSMKHSIAVLPFRDLSPQKDQEYFCDGITEEITNALVNVEGLRVAALTSALQFKGKDLDIRTIGRQLNVNAVLEGSIRKSGSRLRITSQLVNVTDGYHLWSETFDREMEDIFAVQDEISRSIVRTLKIKLVLPEDAPLRKLHTENLEAYNLYLKGRYFWNKRYEGKLQKSLEFFQQAIEKDPAYALAYAGLADAYNIIGYYNFLPPREACPKARAAAGRTLELDPGLAEGLTSLGWFKMFYAWDWEGAEKELRRSLEINPNYPFTHHCYAMLCLAMKRFDEGLAHIRRAQELDPLSLVINATLGVVLYFSRRPEEAIEQYHRTLDLDQSFALAHSYLAGPYAVKGMFDEAIEESRKAVELSGGSTYTTAFLALMYGVSGHKEKARELLEKLLALSRERYVASHHIAIIYLGLDDRDRAFEWLDKALQERDNWLVWLNIHPIYDNIRTDPRFLTLLKQVGLAP